jgi:hypothetical protein
MNKMEVSRADTYCVKSINEHVCEIKFFNIILEINKILNKLDSIIFLTNKLLKKNYFKDLKLK